MTAQTLMKKTGLVFAFALMLGLLVGCSSSEEKSAQYIANGDALFEGNKLNKAALEYRNALQINQNLPDAWYGLARIHERRQEWRKAYSLLLKINDAHPNHVNGRVMLGQMLLASNQIDEAVEDAGEIIEMAP